MTGLSIRHGPWNFHVIFIIPKSHSPSSPLPPPFPPSSYHYLHFMIKTKAEKRQVTYQNPHTSDGSGIQSQFCLNPKLKLFKLQTTEVE